MVTLKFHKHPKKPNTVTVNLKKRGTVDILVKPREVDILVKPREVDILVKPKPNLLINRECSDCNKTESEVGLEHTPFDDDGLEELLCHTCLDQRERENNRRRKCKK